MINNNTIFFENTTEKAFDTEKKSKNVVTSAASPNAFFLLKKNLAPINVKINKSTGNNKNTDNSLVILVTYFIYSFLSRENKMSVKWVVFYFSCSLLKELRQQSYQSPLYDHFHSHLTSKTDYASCFRKGL